MPDEPVAPTGDKPAPTPTQEPVPAPPHGPTTQEQPKIDEGGRVVFDR
jgi:hypothetical protein